ncbi:hypothetical protein A4G20_04905 [Pasteurellaceae bacterium RH1A]|nr:hypothetical protein A4G20_04905 [Pasteurellaceae bacterium RH1A]
MKNTLGLLVSLALSVGFSQTTLAQDFQNMNKERLSFYAEGGNAEAQVYLGHKYYLIQDYSEAFKWFKKAAEQRDMYAQYNLGVMYYRGEGVKQNYKQAFVWVKKAAEQGYKQAQFMIGHMYSTGEGIKKNYEQAFMWLKKAAEQGHKDAQSDIGTMYYAGEGIKQNYEQAFIWLKKAAEHGDTWAQYGLAGMYYYGQGVTKDLTKAREYWTLSCNQGHKNACENLKQLSSQ